MTPTRNDTLDLAYPPDSLRERVGCAPGARGTGAYDAVGLGTKRGVVGALPDDWSWEGKRVLDFGCGAGRLLRHLVKEGDQADIWGCDIHEPSVNWVLENLPFHAFRNTREPRLDLASGSFDLVIATSVFTHVGRDWARWLLELRRILRDGGLLFATFLGPGMIPSVARADWDPELLGMTVLHYANVQEELPNVLHSAWWLREHWGRAFEVVDLRDRGFGEDGEPCEVFGGHGWVLMRRRGEAPTAEELAAVGPDDARELPAALHARDAAWADAERLVVMASEVEPLRHRVHEVAQERAGIRHDLEVLRHERDAVRHDRDAARHERDVARAQLDAALAEHARVAAELAAVYGGGWWRLRRPLRPLLRLAAARCG